jgi:hypothetical protein
LKNKNHFDSICTATDDHWTNALPLDQSQGTDELRQMKSKPDKGASQLDQHQDVKKLVY